jgi:hypothetical protein
MVKVVVTDENRVDLPQSMIVTARDCNARVVENSDSRWVFEQQRTVARTEFTRTLADWCDADRGEAAINSSGVRDYFR